MTHGRVGPFTTIGPFGWLFPTGLMAAAAWLACLGALGAYSLFGHVMPCDVEGRLNALVIVWAVAAGVCLGVGAVRSPVRRTVAGVLGALVPALLTSLLVGAMFRPHC
jgi:hypothetical protein